MPALRVSKTTKITPKGDIIFLADKLTGLKALSLSPAERNHLNNQFKDGKGSASCEQSGRLIMAHVLNGEDKRQKAENARKAGAGFLQKLNGLGRKEVLLTGSMRDASMLLDLAEGMVLANYQFKPYKTNKPDLNAMRKVKIVHQNVSSKGIGELNDVCNAVSEARDLVNRPLSHLNAVDLSKEIKRLGKEAGFKVEVFNKAKIKSLKMGGLLAVNYGSPDPPTFSIMEWKPKNAKNKKPILLVGKGVVYDTGGLSLKPTPNSMDMMKCDMAGSATMIGAMYAIAKQKLPLHVIGLIPATDNRPGLNAYAPGDVITMHDGQTVEVFNTDAEGRMILADAHSWGKRYKPELVIDAATLTGAAVRAIGLDGVVAMGTADDKDFRALEQAGEEVYERIAMMPFWEEYDRELDSDIADMKNLGGPYGGHITAGKFLARFVKDPYIHLDIAGPAFLPSSKGYRPKGGTGVGVRLIYRFLKNRVV